MSVSTSGFVLTENKDVFSVLVTIENTLIEMIRKYATEDTPIYRDNTSQLPRIECIPQIEFCNIHFKVNNEVRMLTVHFNCNGDYSEYPGSKIIWSLNTWGLAEEIILSICKVMTQFGQVFYEANDYEGIVVEVV